MVSHLKKRRRTRHIKCECLGLLCTSWPSGQSGLDLKDYQALHGELGLPLPKIDADADGFDLVVQPITTGLTSRAWGWLS